MSLKETILNRRSVRIYKNESIPEETLHAILEAGLLAPSSRNFKPCEIYAVTDRETLKKLALTKPGAGMLEKAGAAIIVAADSAKADTWVEDSSIAMSYMNLTAAELGIGSCWIQVQFRTSKEGSDTEALVKKILGIEPHMHVSGMLSLGVTEQALPPHTEDDADWTKVHRI